MKTVFIGKLILQANQGVRIIKKRIIYLDILRVLAILAVVILHVSAIFVGNLYANGRGHWWMGNIFDSLTRYSVPIFVMISGKLMFSKESKDIKSFLKKRLIPIIIPLVFWSVIQYLSLHRIDGSIILNIKSFIIRFLTNDIHPHLWYLYYIIGAYMLTPIISPFVKEAKKEDLELFLFITFLINIGSKLFTYKLSKDIFYLETVFSWFIGYYVAGYYFDKYDIKKESKRVIYLLGFSGGLISILGTYFLTKRNGGVIDDLLYSSIMPTVIFISFSIFISVKDFDWEVFFENKPRLFKSLLRMSGTSFGVYLSHSFFIRVFLKYINIFNIKFIFAIPLIFTLTYLSSHIFTFVVTKIPFLKRIV